MRLSAVILLFFFSLFGLAQGPILQFDIQVSDDDTGKKLAGATCEVYQNGQPFKTVTSASNGKFPIIDAPVGSVYTIYIKKDGYVTKVAQVDGTYKYPEDLQPITYVQMSTGIFQKIEGVDFTFLETQPMIKFAFTQDGYQDYDKAYTADMLKKIENLKNQMAQQKAENAKKEEEKKKQEADFNMYMKAGDDAMTAKKYDVAITQYELALKTIPGDPTATTKLEAAKKAKADAEKNAEAEKAYAAKLEQAKAAYTAKNLEQALALYKEAEALKPAEAYPKQQIALIESELAKQKEQTEQFNKLVAEGDVAMNSKLYDDAITKYTAALAIKADPAVQTKLDNAKKLKAEKEKADADAKALEAKYAALIKEADAAFNSKNYALAKTKYSEALGVKAADVYATDQLKKIDEILKKEQADKDAAQKLEADYSKAMSEGEALMTQKNYAAAKQKFEAALLLKPNDSAALAKIDLCNKEIEKQAADAKKNEEYNALMAEAKSLYDQKKYAEAKAKYQTASNLKPDQVEPKNQIAAIEKLLADQEKAAQLEKDYQALMTEGNSLKDIKDYTAAIDRYNKALALKPGDPTATQKIAEINKILDEQKKLAEQEKLFSEYMAKADQAFNAKDYTTAKMNYQKAFEIKADPAITAKINEIDAIIAKTQNEAQVQAKYDAAIKEADALYKAGDMTKALAKYEEASAIKSTEAYPKEKIAEIKQKQSEQQAQAEKDKKYAEYVAAGDAAFTAKDYSKALASYQEAIKIKPDPVITQKIGQLNTLIAEQQQNMAVEEKYKAKIAEADAAYTAKSWETSRDLYREALAIKPNDTYATQRIADIEKQMQAETDAEVEANYQKIIAKADNLKKEERYDEALTYYNNALKLKPGDPYPKAQIDEINRIKQEKLNADQAALKLQQEYDALIKEADLAFNAQNYTVALAKYKEALLKKPGEPYPQGRITEINDKLNAQNQSNQTDTEYQKYISQADALFAQKNYLEAIPLYRQALGVKPNDAYATNQIQESERLEKAKSLEEEEKEYQKILTAAQKKFDEGDYLKALDYYKRAQGIRPNDPIPQKRIDEINQILANQKTNGEFDAFVQQANTYFEKSDWKNAKIYYEKALAIKDDSYCRAQIEKINTNMQGQSLVEIDAQYKKLITKADEYFNAQNYEKAKELYMRAVQLKPSDAYPKEKLAEIDRILNPPANNVAQSGNLPDYGKPINSTELEVQSMLLESDDQRQFMANQSAETQRVDSEDQNTLNANNQVSENWDTQVEANQINQDLEEKEWTAEVKRTEANLEVIEMQVQLEDVQTDLGTTNENTVQQTNQSVVSLNIDIEERNENDDLPREEYLADVEHIKVEVAEVEKTNANYQGDVVVNNTDYVDDMQVKHITSDPNNDVERKNTEVYVEDLSIVIINENNENSWDQEDEVMGVKDHSEVMVDEQIANNINNDIPREESAVVLTNYTLEKESIEANRSSAQYDETVDIKKHGEQMSIDIEENNMDNDIPRQDMEIFVENTELELEDRNTDLSTDQNNVVIESDEVIESLEITQEEANKLNDQPRQDYEVEVVAIDQDIQNNNDNLSALNEDNSMTTKEQTEDITDQKLEKDAYADYNAVKNSDETNKSVENILEENKTISEGNDAEVDKVEDYAEELKHTDIITEGPTPQNELGQKYPEGVTEEIYAMNDENGMMSKYIVRRIVVINGTGYCYEKVQTRYGTITYTKDGQPIAEYQWTDETEAVNLTRN